MLQLSDILRILHYFSIYFFRSGLLVGLEEPEGSVLCLYDLGLSKVVKSVVIPGRVSIFCFFGYKQKKKKFMRFYSFNLFSHLYYIDIFSFRHLDKGLLIHNKIVAQQSLSLSILLSHTLEYKSEDVISTKGSNFESPESLFLN